MKAKDMNGSVLVEGDRVYWHDPDEGTCSGFYTVAAVDVEYVTLENDDGGLVGAFPHECEKANGNGNGRRNKAKH